MGERLLRIRQRVDASGAAAPEEYARPVTETLGLPAHAVAIDLLVALGSRLDDAGRYDYEDPARGAGSVELVGFDTVELERIEDHFRVEDMRSRLGLSRASSQWLDTNTFFTMPRPTRNPVTMIVIGVVGAVFAIVLGIASSVGPMRVPGETVTWVYLPLFGVLLGLFVAVIVQHGRRRRGWSALRAAFRAEGGRMPHSLRIGE